VALTGATLTLLLRGSLPQLDGNGSLAGLDARVVVERDVRGIPHLSASSKADLARATGYLHAQDRFFQMDLLRRSAAGELAALFGRSALAADEYLRIHRFRAQAAAIVGELEPSIAALLAVYVDGVNAGLQSLRARPFEYWILRASPEPWRQEDSVLVLLAMFLDLQEERDQTDATREAIRRGLTPSMARLFLAEGSPWDAPLVGGALPSPPLPTADEMSAPGLPEEIIDPGGADAVREQGSNAWAIDGSRSSHGGAILANDMHLDLGVPNVWYPVHWEWEEGGARRRAIGMTLPGAPALVVGSNGSVAWGFTNSYVDGVDLVELVDADADSYKGVEGRVPFRRFDETIEVKGGQPVALSVRWSEFGPVLGEDPPRAVQWIAHELAAVNLDLVRMQDAVDIEASLEILHDCGIPAQNVVLAASDGRIAWTVAGRLPRRAFDGRFTVRSDDVRARWSGLVASSQVPAVVDPASGFVWSANNRAVCCAELELLGDGGYSLAARAGQIRDALAEMGPVGEAEMLGLQLDDRALFLRRWRDLLLRVLEADEEVTPEVVARIRDDSDRASSVSTGYGLVRRFRLEVHERVLDAWVAPAAGLAGFDRSYLLPQVEESVWQAVNQRPPHLLPQGFLSWDALLADAWSEASGAGLWGERNRLQMRHPLSRALPLLSRWLDMPAESVAGDSRMPRVQGPGFGPSERLVVSPGKEEVAIFHMPGGVSGHPLSPFYRAGHRDWVDGRATRFVAGEIRYRLELRP